METTNQKILKKLKKKYSNLNIDKPVHSDGYWDNIKFENELVINETNNTSKKV